MLPGQTKSTSQTALTQLRVKTNCLSYLLSGRSRALYQYKCLFFLGNWTVGAGGVGVRKLIPRKEPSEVKDNMTTYKTSHVLPLSLQILPRS